MRPTLPSAAVVAESCLAPLLSQPQQLSDWSLLALFLAEQLYLCDRAGGSSSSAAWAPYIGVLPRNPIGTVLDWSQKDVGNSQQQQIGSCAALRLQENVDGCW